MGENDKMTKYKCVLCDREIDDEKVEVRHYGLKSACLPCVRALDEE